MSPSPEPSPTPPDRRPSSRRMRRRALKATLFSAHALRWASNRLLAAVRRGLRPDDVAEITAWCYGRRTDYARPGLQRRGLARFEEAALRAHFPPPPARVLVPGCGGGRELIALRERGYAVSGCDPARPLAMAARRATAPDTLVAVGGLEEVARLFAGERFDAVMVGWGAWGYLTRAPERVTALRNLRALAPSGPILLSWPALETEPVFVAAPEPGPAPRSGTGSAWRERLRIDPSTGVGVMLSVATVRREAESAGLVVAFDGTVGRGYPHVVLASDGRG